MHKVHTHKEAVIYPPLGLMSEQKLPLLLLLLFHLQNEKIEGVGRINRNGGCNRKSQQIFVFCKLTAEKGSSHNNFKRLGIDN